MKKAFTIGMLVLFIWQPHVFADAGEKWTMKDPFGIADNFSVELDGEQETPFELPDVHISGPDEPKDPQLTVRLGYEFDYSDKFFSQIGVSASRRNDVNKDRTLLQDQWEKSIHFSGGYGPFKVRLVASSAAQETAGRLGLLGNRNEQMDQEEEALLDFSSYSAGLSYEIPVKWGPVSKLTFYNDYTVFVEKKDRIDDFQSETIGCIVNAGDFFSYVDFSWTNDSEFMETLHDQDADGAADWRGRFVFKLGYFF